MPPPPDDGWRPSSAPGSALPDTRRPGLTAPTAPLAAVVGEAALALTWRMLQARSREPYVIRAPETPLRRVYYTADDGWRAPLFHLPARPGSPGEPVLLAHGLGGTHRDFALEPARSLATALTQAGYAVYLLEHRGDRSALPPADASPFSVDDIATRDLDAAIDAVRADSGYPRVLFVGHGLGAQALYLLLAWHGADRLVAAVTVAGSVRFERPATAARAASTAALLLPPNWVLPTRRLHQLASPLVATGEDLASPTTEGPVARAWMRYAAGDLHLGVLRQVSRWATEGVLTDAGGRLDVVAALRPLPALVVEPDADPACPKGSALPAAEALRAHVLALTGGWGHLDPLLGRDAPTVVHAEIVRFFEAWRRRCA